MRALRPRRSGAFAAVLGAALLTAAACGTSPTPSTGPSTTTGTTTGTTQAPATSAPTGTASQLWAQTWTPKGEGPPVGAEAVAVSPSGSAVYVAGSGPTIAYAAATGRQLWLVSDSALPNGALAAAVSPDGSRVYVTGPSSASGTGDDYLTVAYAAATGARLWTARYDGPGKGADDPAALVATGGLVVVNGVSAGAATGADFATVAYDATTGQQRWVARYDGPGHGDEGWFPSGQHSLAVDPGGTTVYVTGGSATSASQTGYATVAYAAQTGARRWVARFGDAGTAQALALAVAVSPDGSTVAVTGYGESPTTKADMATVAYAASTGAQRWVARYNGPASQNEGGGSIAFAPTGGSVFVTGTSEGATEGKEDVAIVAYDVATGSQRWAQRYDAPEHGDDNAAALALSTDGSRLYVTGRTVPSPMLDEYVTVAYATGTGSRIWTMRHGVAGGTADGERASEAHAIAVSPTDGTVFVTGLSGRGYATLAYRG